ncbi:MAG: Ig-like domain-containing protein, partial [Spirochaetes bacterium]|nr:Ig-like domain-containing protein [Spirochaetota bacterium]
GTYSSTKSISVTTLEGGTVICYTVDGSSPAAATPGTCSAGSQINEGQNIAISSSLTLKVLATRAGYYNSAITSVVYTFNTYVKNTTPSDGAVGLDPNSGTITINFNQSVDRSTAIFNETTDACTGNIQLSADGFTNCVGLTIPAGNTASLELTPAAPLTIATTYKLQVTATLKDTVASPVLAATQSVGIKTRYYRTEAIDGINNFVAGETFSTSTSGYTTYLTWDAQHLYIGYSGADVAANATNKSLLVYFGSGVGATTGIAYGTQTQSFPTNFWGKYHLRWRTDNGLTGTQTYMSPWSGSTPLPATEYKQSGNYVEFRIGWSAIGSPATLKIYANMITDSGGESTYGMCPLDGFTDGFNAQPAKYLTCNWTDGNLPTTSCTKAP